MILSDAIKEAIIEHAAAAYPHESCGLILQLVEGLEYVACKNIATKGLEHFLINPADYEEACLRGDIVAIVHSHPDARPTPSQADLVACEATALPWVIVGYPTKEFHVFQPNGYQAPLVGREFCQGVLDCWSSCEDWYAREWGLKFPAFYRQGEWWKGDDSLYMKNLDANGFDVIGQNAALTPPEAGDLIIMQIGAGTKQPNHAAVYLGRGRILHHLRGQLSAEDIYGGYYQKHTIAICRYRSRPQDRDFAR